MGPTRLTMHPKPKHESDTYQLKVLGMSRDHGLIITELMEEGNLADWIKRTYRQHDMETALKLACDVIHGLMELHDNRIWHWDIKPANILLTTRLGILTAIVAGIGFGPLPFLASNTGIRFWISLPCFRLCDLRNCEGRNPPIYPSLNLNIFNPVLLPEALTKQDIAPEVFDGRGSSKADIYSFGWVLVDLMYNPECNPFRGAFPRVFERENTQAKKNRRIS